MSVDVTVPSVGESITEVFVGTWLKQAGEAVRKDEAIVEIETDKATVEVPAPVDGVLAEQLVAAGGAAMVGDVVARIEPGTAAAAVAKAPASGTPVAAEAAPVKAVEPVAEAPAASKDDAKVMPAAQRAMADQGLSPAQVKGSGPGGRILKEDVQRVAAQAAQPAAPTPQPQNGERQEEAVPMSPLRRRIAQRLVEAQHTAALLTTFNEADMSAVMALRSEYKDAFERRYGVRLGFMSFFVKAAIDALREIPQLNAEIKDEHIVYKNYYDMGVAVSTPKGLVVPVLRNAERMSFAQVESAIGDFGKRAQTGKLTPDELQGGTFTITNGGIFGSLMSTPIVNPPQSGVLGMHAIQERPIALKGQVVIRPMMYLALSYDHRIVDGREAVTFLKRVKEGIEQPARLLLEV